MANKDEILSGLAEIVNEETGLETEEVQLEKNFKIGRASCREREQNKMRESGRRHTIPKRDWSSDVCSSDLTAISHRSALTRKIVHTRAAERLHADLQGAAHG